MRAAVDIVIPFRGSRAELLALLARTAGLRLGSEDTLTIVDNTRGGVAGRLPSRPGAKLVRAPQVRSSYHARNQGAIGGRGTWILFLDADVDPSQDLIERYLTPAPKSTTALLVGSVRDVAASDDGRESLASRYSRLRRLIDQVNTLQTDRPYAKTANCMVRRTAFEQAGGFAATVRSGGDADLCFRLRDGGWGLEPRPGATVEHRSRNRLPALLAQRARHGSGADWLESSYPGFVGPRQSLLCLGRRLLTGPVRASLALRHGDRDEALLVLLDPLSNAAYDIGRRLPNRAWR